MTTPPEARLYRISRDESVLARSRPGQPGQSPAAQAGTQAGPSVRVEVRKRANAPASAAPASDKAAQKDTRSSATAPGTQGDGPQTDRTQTDRTQTDRTQTDGTPVELDAKALAAAVDKVKAERLTPRQLRVAHRIARSHGIVAESDEEAVVKLRQIGIDPLQRAGLRKVVADEGRRASQAPAANTPSILPGPKSNIQPLRSDGGLPAPSRPNLPSREMLTEQKRAAEILKIQRDIAKRRRRRMAMMFARIAAFVILPTIVAGYYYYAVATPLYATSSQFQIQKADGSSTSSLGGLFQGSQMATNTDSVAVQSYLESRDAMMRLDNDLGFKRVFEDPSMDPLTRLSATSTMDDAYKIYKDVVKVSYDPTEGVVGLEVAAPDPKLSQDFSLALIRYAEGQVDQMTARVRDDQMTGAQQSYADAEGKVHDAQMRIQDLQQKLGVLDPASENQAAMSHISTLENELVKKELELGSLQANATPNASRVRGLEGEITRLEEMIAERRAQLTQQGATGDSLAAVTGEIRVAEGELRTREQLLAAAAGQLEAARVEANKQVRYLSLSVAPVPPDEPTYPTAWQNTLVAFLILSGVYLMLSLTASILREQVSS